MGKEERDQVGRRGPGCALPGRRQVIQGRGEKSHDGKAPTDDNWGAVTGKGPETCAEHMLGTISNV